MDKKRERKEVKEDSRLADLCEKEYAEKGEFERSLAECFKGLLVKHLKGYTEETLKKHVMDHGGPDGLVPGWLVEHRLEGYLKPTKKAKASEEAPGSSSSSPSKEVARLFEQIKNCNVETANTLVEPPDGNQWLCGLAEKEPLFVRPCYGWFYDEAVRRMSEARVPKCPGLIYTGNPGIGKSSWLNYALVRFLQDDYAVVLERAKTKDYWLFRDDRCIHRRKPIDIFVLDELSSSKAVYLFDPDENDSHPLESNVFTIVATSPQEKHYKARGIL